MITDISIIEKSKVKSKNFLTSPFIYPYLLIKSSIVSNPNKEITVLKNITANNINKLKNNNLNNSNEFESDKVESEDIESEEFESNDFESDEYIHVLNIKKCF